MEKEKIKNSLTVSYIIKSNNLKQKNIDKIKESLNLFFINAKYPNGPIHAEVIYNKKTNKIYFVESHQERQDLMYIINYAKKLLD